VQTLNTIKKVLNIALLKLGKEKERLGKLMPQPKQPKGKV